MSMKLPLCNLSFKSFTLIELLIVIVIIGILAVSLLPRITGIQAKARDTKRIADMRTIQTALEMYYIDHGRYPITSMVWRGNCSTYGSHPVTGPTGYIPHLAPQYISILPLDPKQSNSFCYLYKSNGEDYMFLIYGTVEGKVSNEYKRVQTLNHPTFAIYTPGAKGW